MDVFSLEDDEYEGLFLTQESKEKEKDFDEKKVREVEQFLGVEPMDFSSPCSSLLQRRVYTPQCSDVSSDEEFAEVVEGRR